MLMPLYISNPHALVHILCLGALSVNPPGVQWFSIPRSRTGPGGDITQDVDRLPLIIRYKYSLIKTPFYNHIPHNLMAYQNPNLSTWGRSLPQMGQSRGKLLEGWV
jgi:hypothetical protein